MQMDLWIDAAACRPDLREVTANVPNVMVGTESRHRVSSGSAFAHALMVTKSDAADGAAADVRCHHFALDLCPNIACRRRCGHPDNRSQRRRHFRPVFAFVLKSRCRAHHLHNGNRRRY